MRAQAKVRQLEPPGRDVHHEDVGGLQVGMEEVGKVEPQHGLRHIAADGQLMVLPQAPPMEHDVRQGPTPDRDPPAALVGL